MKKTWFLLLTVCLLTGCSRPASNTAAPPSGSSPETVKETSCPAVPESEETKEPSPSQTSPESSPETDESLPEEEPGETLSAVEAVCNPEAYRQAQEILEKAEKEFADIQKQWDTDSYLSQFEMNSISYDGYVVWDNALNRIWAILKQVLPSEEMVAMITEERAWIQEKEDAVSNAAEESGGGSLSILVANDLSCDLTRKRAYYLAEKLNGN